MTGHDPHTVQSGGLSFAEGFTELLPKIAEPLGYMIGSELRVDDLQCGRHGCVLFTDDRAHVVKITGDPSEALGWLYVQRKQREGVEAFLAGAAHVVGIWKVKVDFPGMFGNPQTRTFGVALVERVIPGHRSHHRRGDRGKLTRAVNSYVTRGTYEPIRRINDRLTSIGVALHKNQRRKLVSACKSVPSQLAGLCRMVRAAAKDDVWFEDVELHNVGWRLLPKPASLVLFDFGRVEMSRSLRRRLARAWRAIPIHDLR